jgi:hypothetical protein
VGIVYGVLVFFAVAVLSWMFTNWKISRYLSWVLFVASDFSAKVLGNKEYQKRALEMKSVVDLSVFLINTPLENRPKKIVEWLVVETATLKSSGDKAAVEHWVRTIQLLFESHPELNDNLMFVVAGHYERLDVRKLTVLMIDVLKQFFDLKDKLSSDYFKQLIFGLNKALILLRNNGVTEHNLKEIYKTLFRVYRLTQSYTSLQRNKHLTEKEFYAKVAAILARLSA